MGIVWDNVSAPDQARPRFVADHGPDSAALWNIKYLHIDRQAGQPAASVINRTQGAGNLNNHPASPMGD
jgi:hypothetical protein